MSLIFGTSGIPASTPVAITTASKNVANESTCNGIMRIAELGLECMELGFVHNVYIKESETSNIKDLAIKNKVKLSCHAPYYINLNAVEEDKIARSHQYIYRAAKIANMCGADTVVLHAGFYLGMDSKKVYAKIKNELSIIQNRLDKENISIKLRPEVSGKISQFGTFDELSQLAKEDDRISFCVDWAHWHAREGKFNSYDEFDYLLKEMKNRLGEQAIKNVHFHVSGIQYGPKGELKHLPLQESDFNYHDMVKAWVDNDIEGKIISESPNREEDALLLQDLYHKLKL